MKNNWLQNKPAQHWYQNHDSKPWEKPIHKHDQEEVTRRYLLRETPQRKSSWNSRKKSLSPGCKEMLLIRMKEIEAFNASKESVKAREHGEGSGSTQKEKRARWIVKPTIKKVAEKVKYPEKVHVITDYMIEGTDDGTWNETWKEEIEKKFIFSYGIGDVTMEAREEQGYTVEISNNKCYIHYMFGGKGKGKAQVESVSEDDGFRHVVTEHKKFLDKYFKSIEPKDEGSWVKGLEELKWDRNDVQDYMDDEYISRVYTRLKDIFSKQYVDMLKWFYLVHLNYDMLEKIPPVVGVMEINLLSLHKIVDNLGGYLCVTLGEKWKTVAELQGLIDDDGEAMKECSQKGIKDPTRQGKRYLEKKALEEDMNMKTHFGVRLVGNMEEEAEQGSITDSNDFEVIV
ncbi:ARID DNA-binding domain-containing protein [Tanacetum coccineum]